MAFQVTSNNSTGFSIDLSVGTPSITKVKASGAFGAGLPVKVKLSSVFLEKELKVKTGGTF